MVSPRHVGFGHFVGQFCVVSSEPKSGELLFSGIPVTLSADLSFCYPWLDQIGSPRFRWDTFAIRS